MTFIKASVVILAKTKMADPKICVGAYDLDNHKMIRLLEKNESALNNKSVYEVGGVYSISYRQRNKLSPPHLEDVAVLNHIFVKDGCDNELKDVVSGACIENTCVTELFDFKLERENKSFFISKSNNISYSVTIASLRYDLYKDNEYYKNSHNNSAFSIKYVGFFPIDQMPDVIHAGTKIRFSLARMWDKDKNNNFRSYLQLSGIY